MRILNVKDYHLCEKFFRKCNPKCRDINWLQDYFNEMIQEEMGCGIIISGELVCCTDSPAMPYMNEFVQEIGINTLE